MADLYETFEFIDGEAFQIWLAANFDTTDGIWIKMHKKASGLPSIDYAQALDVALAHGWIDGQRKSYDEISFLQKYTPRRPRSLWSMRNVEHIERLTAAGVMTPAGIHEVEKARADGRWAAAYDPRVELEYPEQFLLELNKHPKALEKFNSLSKSAKHVIGWQLQTAKKEETKIARGLKIINDLEAN